MNQRKQILAHLLKHGQINDQAARQMGISRLPAIVHRLRHQGYPLVYLDIGNASAYVLSEEMYELLQRRM